MSRVFVAEDQDLDRKVVVKVLPPDLAAGVNLERFKREIQLAGQLHHPNIVPVLAAGQSSSLLYYTMPLIGGSTLRSVMDRERQLRLDDALRFTHEIAAALSYAHARNIVHRDIKPENVLVDDRRALVTDFGIARAIERSADLDSVTSTGLTLGTPTYMSPEQAAAEKVIDGRSDIYSLACVVFEMLAGEPPFTAANARTLVAKHIHERPPSVRTARPDLPEHIERTLFIALAKSPADRFRTADEFMEALEEPARTAEWKLPTWPRRRRRAAFVMVPVALGVAIAMLVWQRPRSTPVAQPFDPTRIAVLAFEPALPDSGLSVIGRALAKDIIDALRHAPGLSPISYDAVRRLPASLSLDSVSKILRATTFVTGSLESRGDSIRVTVHLVDARTLLETEHPPIRVQYPRAMLIQLRDTVVEIVGRELLPALGRAARTREWRSEARSPEAWSLRQRAQEMVEFAAGLPRQSANFAPQLAALRAADSILALASKADPAWPEPYVARGWAWYARNDYVDRVAEAAHLDSAIAFGNRALAARANSPRALELLGTVRLMRWINIPQTPPAFIDSAESNLRQAIQLDANLWQAWQSLSLLLDIRGDTQGANDAARRAREADAYFENVGRTMTRLVFRHLFDRQSDSARHLCVRARARLSADDQVQSCLLSVLGWSGRGTADVALTWSELARAERTMALTAGIFPVGRFWVAAVLARSGFPDSARAVLARTRSTLDSAGFAGRFRVNEAQVLTALGDRAGAIDALEAAVRADPDARAQVARLPWFDDLRSEPRFRQLIGTR